MLGCRWNRATSENELWKYNISAKCFTLVDCDVFKNIPSLYKAKMTKLEKDVLIFLCHNETGIDYRFYSYIIINKSLLRFIKEFKASTNYQVRVGSILLFYQNDAKTYFTVELHEIIPYGICSREKYLYCFDKDQIQCSCLNLLPIQIEGLDDHSCVRYFDIFENSDSCLRETNLNVPKLHALL